MKMEINSQLVVPRAQALLFARVRIVHLPERVRLLLFDIDGTLYDSPEYQDFQIRRIVSRMANHLGQTVPETDQRIAEVRRSMHPRKPALSEVGLSLGIPLSLTVEWRSHDFVPRDFLATDANLRDALSTLLNRGYEIAALTNNPASVGFATLEALGVADRFSVLVGLDDAGAPKPDPSGFRKVLSQTGVAAKEVLSIGDRHDVDLKAVLDAGGGGLLVHRVQDIYTLPEVLP